MIENEIDELSPGEFENVKYKGVLKKPSLTFFYERNDGLVFAAENQEAATGKYNKKFRFLGWSDGSTFIKTLQAAKLTKGQVVSKGTGEQLNREAFEAELKAAKKNLANAKKNGTQIPRPRRIEWFFDSSVPENEQRQLSGGNYGHARIDNSI